MRKGRYKLVEWYEKSVFGEDEAFEVYDLVDDPAEQKNLASSKPALVKSMVAEFKKWRKDRTADQLCQIETCGIKGVRGVGVGKIPHPPIEKLRYGWYNTDTVQDRIDIIDYLKLTRKLMIYSKNIQKKLGFVFLVILLSLSVRC